MTIPYIIAAAACAWAIYQTAMNRALVRETDDLRTLCRTLHALRSRCFITNERGHRVRYIKASPEARARAEQV